MAAQSLAARLRVVVGQLRGCEAVSSSEGLPQVAAALREHAAAVDLLLEAVEQRDRMRASVARRAGVARSPDAA